MCIRDRFTSGLAIGHRRIIRTNTVGGMLELSHPDIGSGSRPAIGDTFVVESPASIISYTGQVFLGSSHNVGDGNGLVLSQLRFARGATGTLTISPNSLVYAETVQVDAGGGSFVLDKNAMFYAGGYDSAAYSNLSDTVGATNRYGCGLYVRSTSATGVQVLTNSQLYAIGLVVRGGTGLRFWGPNAYGQLMAADVAGLVEFASGSVGRIISSFGLPTYIHNSTTNGILIDLGAVLEKLGPVMLSNNAANGVLVQANSTVQTNGLITGTGNGGAGIEVKETGVVHVTESTNTVTGTGGELKAGTTTSTWTDVWGGTALSSFPAGVITK